MTKKVEYDTPRFISTKTYNHNVGLTATFRQWRAESHCRFLHGYALEVGLQFIEVEGLDVRNWVVDFGSLKTFKGALEDLLDHKTLVAEDDPAMDHFQYLEANGLIQLRVVPRVGCEGFAELIYGFAQVWLHDNGYAPRVALKQVEIREHSGNSAIAVNPEYV